MFRRRTAFLSAGVLAVVTAFLATPAQAVVPAPVAITCGAVLTHNAYLAADLTCPTGNGVTVAASLSIDLQGHHLTGNRGGVGITVDYPAAVKVTHGRLTGWGTGLTTVSTVPNPESAPATITVIAVTFLDNGTGIAPGEVEAADASGFTPTYTVYRSWFLYNQIGVGGSVGNTEVNVSGATFRNNQTAVSFNGDGYDFIGGVTVSDSEISNNTVGVYCAFSSCTLHRNGFSANPTAVRTDDFFSYLEMTGNTVTGSTTGVDVEGSFIAALTGNTFTGNVTAVMYNSGGGSVQDNVFTGNGSALTMADAGGTGDEDLYSAIPVSGNQVSNNTVNGMIITGGGVQLKKQHLHLQPRLGHPRAGRGRPGRQHRLRQLPLPTVRGRGLHALTSANPSGTAGSTVRLCAGSGK